MRAASPLPRRADEVRVLGPGGGAARRGARRYRFRLLVKSPRGFDLSAYLRDWLAAAPKRKGNVKLDVDVDPQSFLYQPSRGRRVAGIAGAPREAWPLQPVLERAAPEGMP